MSTLTPAVGRPSSTLHFVVGEMNGKLDQLIASLIPQFASIHLSASELDLRVTAVERNMWRAIGGGSVLVFILGSWELVRYVILQQ